MAEQQRTDGAEGAAGYKAVGHPGNFRLHGGKLESVSGDADLHRPAAGMTSASLHHPARGEASSKNVDVPKTLEHVYGRSGKLHHEIDENREVAAGISTMELCPDPHEFEYKEPPPKPARETMSDIIHGHHGHPDHLIEGSAPPSSHPDNNGYGQAKGKTVIRGGKLVHMHDELDNSLPPAGCVSKVHARSTSAELRTCLGAGSGVVLSPNPGLHPSVTGGRMVIRGGKLVRVADEPNGTPMPVAGARSAELAKAQHRR